MAQPDDTSHDNPGARVYPVVARVGAYSWWLVGIGVVGLGVLWLVARLWVLLLAAAVAAAVVVATGDEGDGINVEQAVKDNVQDQIDELRNLVEDNTQQ